MEQIQAAAPSPTDQAPADQAPTDQAPVEFYGVGTLFDEEIGREKLVVAALITQLENDATEASIEESLGDRHHFCSDFWSSTGFRDD